MVTLTIWVTKAPPARFADPCAGGVYTQYLHFEPCKKHVRVIFEYQIAGDVVLRLGRNDIFGDVIEHVVEYIVRLLIGVLVDRH